MTTYDIPKEYLGNPRNKEDIISKEAKYMLSAILWSKEGEDPSTQVGACIVNKDGNIITGGCNNPSEQWEGKFPYKTDVPEEYNKYSYIIHAEMNGIFNYKGPIKDLEGATMYVTLFPCINCAKLIATSKIKKVVYLHDTRKDSTDNFMAKVLLSRCGIEYEEFDKTLLKGIELNIDAPNEKEIAKIKCYKPEEKVQ